MKKILSLLLAGLMLLSMAACAQTNDSSDDGKGTQADDANNAETEDPTYSLSLSSGTKYSGETVSFIYPKNSNTVSEIYTDNLGKGVVSDSVYERNLAVEERLTIKFEFNEKSDVMGDVTKDIQSGLGDYELVSNPIFTTISSVVEGKFLNLSNLEKLDMDKGYWSRGFNDMVTFTDNNMQFLVSGAPAISMYRLTYMTLYNKSLFKDNQLPDLYDIVVAGQWTLDKQYALSKDHYVDADGDGAVSENDFYGFVTGNCVSVDPYMVSTGTNLIIKDPDTNDLVFNAEAKSKLSDVCDKIQLLYNDDSTYAYQGSDHDNTSTTDVMTHFTKEKALMVTSMFNHMEMNYAELAPLTYGIAPMPKFDTNQKNYYSYVQDQVTAFGISAVVGDPERQEMCAATLEAMAYFSYKLVRPAYYDTALSERYMQDPQSKEILDLIFDTVYFDFSSTCCNMLSVQPRDQLRSLLTGKSNTIASSTKVWEKQINNNMKSINKKLDRVAENQSK